jgi:16S rRNA (cytosine967-C5)-methyltransferase
MCDWSSDVCSSDLVLVDAPCSGLGVLSRRPDAKHRRSPADVADLVRLQAAILDSAWATLRPGGTLAYLTCTLVRAENEEQVRGFLDRHPGAVLAAEWQTPPGTPLGEFFYGAALRKK